MSDDSKPAPLAAASKLVSRVGSKRDLEARVTALEAEVAESRRLSLRIAELTDIVAELLVPLAQQDPGKAAELLERYQQELGS